MAAVAYAAVFAVAISQLAGAPRLLGNADYLRTFTPDQLRTQALSPFQPRERAPRRRGVAPPE
jgi:hypothetical protein